jgi:HAE1 family hydrophobic/amphiphilic exporter-1
LLYTGRFNSKEEYENIPLKATYNGEILKLKDIADVELGTEYFDVDARFNGRPSAAIVLKQLPGSNAREVINNVKKRMSELKETMFLKGSDYEISYDISRFMDASIHEVVKTFIEALLLVALIVSCFAELAGNTHTRISSPVSLVGNIFFHAVSRFSLNLITLFALVLASELWLNNAIVVVEAVYGKMEHSNMSAKSLQSRP